ncbi:hypothetical protein KY331_05105 [Candidatus Woesearchaeota archaeon]|nr:hypothetical protein [Candidatus Woesearchaeota archaeon]
MKKNKKRGKPVFKDFLRAESIDELVSSEERDLFRTQRFLGRQMIMHEIEQLQKQQKKPVKRGKPNYSLQGRKGINYKPLKYKPIIYIPLKARNMFRTSYRRRFKKGKIRRGVYRVAGLGRRKMRRERINRGSKKGYLEGIVQRDSKILPMPYQPGRGYAGYTNTKAA